MTVLQLYEALNARIPSSLSCDWDNDGLMCCPAPQKEVRRALVCLDATAAMAERAIAGGFDVILTHHPLIFHKLAALDPADPIANRLLRLIPAEVAVMSFHTRLDALPGGVNDALADRIGLCEVFPYGAEGIGRIGVLPSPMPLADFAALVKRVLDAPAVAVADAGVPVHRVAVLGGKGADDVRLTETTGADTFLSGELASHQLTDAPERGMNLVAAGHFYTEHPVCRVLADMLAEIDPAIEVEIAVSNPVRLL